MTDTIFERNDTLYNLDPEHSRIADELNAQGVKYAMANWIDVLGRPKSKVVPLSHFADLVAGAERYTPRGFGGIGSMNPTEDEVVGVPDLSTLKVLPWDKRYAWMLADMSFGGREPFALCPRAALRKQVDAAAEMGYTVHLGVEPEFYVFRPESLDSDRLIPIAHTGSLRPSPAYDIEATLDASEFFDKLVGYLADLDFGVYAFGHEGGAGQYELSVGHAPVLEMADRMTLFRFAVKQVAKECGLLATFMPKPYDNMWGSGAHLNMSLVDKATGINAFRGESVGQWTETTYQFIAGVLKHAPAFTALGNPTTNSYRRLTPRLADGQISWAPTRVSYGSNNRSCTVRLPQNRPCIEYRAADSAANYYFASALMIAAGLEGIREGLDPGAPLEEASHNSDAPSLPRTLLEAVEAFQADPLVHETFPPAFVREYTEMKVKEWETDHLLVSDAERARYLLEL
ncbi:glutamate-ammonia ligase (plasmid) [Rhodococcus opacus]|uniref:Glutamate-ammonia ligase n=1 Tax=Rhodococcus opacus TaxID=37919 RepID=A0A1B1KH51_RHOOP|nr:glutamine synthetase family protein [Rhodococcus opacus]ANS31936.1 glutamate-ammonia ligase [Rhodococcus opacus]